MIYIAPPQPPVASVPQGPKLLSAQSLVASVPTGPKPAPQTPLSRLAQSCRALTCALTALAVALALALPAEAYLYAGKRKKINCGIVVVGGATQPLGSGLAGGVGDLFFLLDQRVDMKPGEWSLENPLAPGSPSTGLGKNNPAYWTVDLRSTRSLARMHVLYLPASGSLSLDIQSREKLRQFVDGGGVLWIDNAGTGGQVLDFNSSFFIQNFLFDPAMGGGFDVPASRHHPVLTLPYWINDMEIASLGANPGRCDIKPGYDPVGTGGWVDVGSQPLNFDVLYPVVNNSSTSKPSVAANAYGSGRIVVTANFVGRGCYFDYPLSIPNVKFAYNVIAWSSSWTHLRKDPRHSGSSIDTVGGTKLLESWALPAASSADIETAPVIHKNVVFYTSGGTLFAAGLVPQDDLDHDGNPDDGLPGLPGGMADKGQDIIWRWPDSGAGVGTLSAPSVVSIQNPANPNESIEAVLVMSGTGMVHMLEAFPNVNGVLVPQTTEIMARPMGPATSKPYPPIYINGWIYAVGGNGRLYAYNPSLAAWQSAKPGNSADPEWQIPGAADTGFSASPRSGPTFGFVKNETSGAVVGMVYWYISAPASSGVTSAEQNDHVFGVPVYVCNDRVRIERSNSAGTMTECRLSYRDGWVSESPPVSVQILSAGTTIQPMAVEANKGLVGGATAEKMGSIVITTAAGIPSDAVVYATYALDYASTVGRQSAVPARMRLPIEPRSNATNGVPQTEIVGIPALGPDSMMYFGGTRGSGSTGDSVYGIKNDGTIQFTKWHYYLHNGAAGFSAPIPSPVFDEQGRMMQNIQMVSSPAVAGDKVFTVVSGNSSAPGGPTAALLCFKANSDFVIRITENAGYDSGGKPIQRPKRLINSTTNREMSVKIWQPNMMVPGTMDLSPLTTAVPVPKDMIDYQRGTITFDNFDRLKLRGGIGNVMQTNTFSPSLPVWVFVDNIEVPIDFSTWGPTAKIASLIGQPLDPGAGDAVDLGGWNNLLWYYIIPPHDGNPCSGIHSSPVVIGSTVYFTCDDGHLYAFPTETGETSGGPTSAKPIWSQQIAARGSAGASTSVAGSNGVLLVPASDGLHAFTNATTLIADSKRVIEVDGSGEISWSIESIAWPASIPVSPGSAPPRRSGSINKPARAKYAGPGEVLIANSGANQVCKVDKSGTVGLVGLKAQIGGNLQDGFIRWIWDKFTDPKRLLRPGQPTNIVSPTDALFWQEWENSNLVIHCLIADSGNHRIVDLVYRFALDSKRNPTHLIAGSADPRDPSTGFILPELNWVSATDSMNERYVYECLQLVPEPTTGGFDVWAAVSNFRTGTGQGVPGTGQGLGGAIVALRYRVQTGGPGTWNYGVTGSPSSGEIYAACDRVNWGGEKPLANPRSFLVVDKPDGRFLIICDNYGVYVAGLQGGGTPSVVRAIKDADYRGVRRSAIVEGRGTSADIGPLGVPLVPTSVHELPNGNWLIANSYSGANTSGSKQFNGEVFEVSWGTGGAPDIKWSSPSIYCEADPAGDPIPDSWRQRTEKSYILQQPKSAVRQF